MQVERLIQLGVRFLKIESSSKVNYKHCTGEISDIIERIKVHLEIYSVLV